MGEVNRDLDALDARVRELEKIVAALSTAPRMPNTSQKGGTYRLISPNTEDDMLRFGEFTASGVPFYGLVLYDGDNHSMVMTRDDVSGMIKPDIPVPFHLPDGVAITDAVLTTHFVWQARHIYHDVLNVSMSVITDAATTGEVRLREAFSGRVTSTVTVPISHSGSITFEWLHAVELGDDPGDNAQFNVEARRASGAGSFTLFPPLRASMTSSALVSGADANGHAILL